ncbi:hypothetical protein ACVWXN_000522 [Bradyrhizobium sp. i1.4.4]
MIVAACGSDGDPEGLGLQDVEERGRSGAEKTNPKASTINSRRWRRS